MADFGRNPAYIDPIVAWNLLLFGRYARRVREVPFRVMRQLELHQLMAAYDFRRALGLLPYQQKEAAQRRGAHTPVIPLQRSKTAAAAEDTLFNRFPKTRARKERA